MPPALDIRVRASLGALLLFLSHSAAAATAGAGGAGICLLTSGPAARQKATVRAIRATLPSSVTALDAGDGQARLRAPAVCTRVAIALGNGAMVFAAEVLPRVAVVHALASPTAAGATSGQPRYGLAPYPDPTSVLATLAELAPNVRRVGLVYDPARTGTLVSAAQNAARSHNLQLVALAAGSLGGAVRAFYRFEKAVVIDALWLLPDATTSTRETVHYALELAHWLRIPVVGPSRWYAASGALFALAPDYAAHGKQVARAALQLAAGRPPPALSYAHEDLLIINRRTAARLQLQIPRSVAARAKEVLE